MSDDNAEDGTVYFPLPDNYTLLDWCASMECLNESGQVVLLNVFSEESTAWKRLGMAQSLAIDARDRMTTAYDDEDAE